MPLIGGDWIKLTRPDGGDVWLNRSSDYWRIMVDLEDPTTTVIDGPGSQRVKATPEEVMKALREGA